MVCEFDMDINQVSEKEIERCPNRDEETDAGYPYG